MRSGGHHAVDAGRGRILVHISNHNQPNGGETIQTESADGGPPLLLRYGRLLMTYGSTTRMTNFGLLPKCSKNGGASGIISDGHDHRDWIDQCAQIHPITRRLE